MKVRVEFFNSTSWEFAREHVEIDNPENLREFEIGEEEFEKAEDRKGLPKGYRILVCNWVGDPITGVGSYFILAEKTDEAEEERGNKEFEEFRVVVISE